MLHLSGFDAAPGVRADRLERFDRFPDAAEVNDADRLVRFGRPSVVKVVGDNELTRRFVERVERRQFVLFTGKSFLLKGIERHFRARANRNGQRRRADSGPDRAEAEIASSRLAARACALRFIFDVVRHNEKLLLMLRRSFGTRFAAALEAVFRRPFSNENSPFQRQGKNALFNDIRRADESSAADATSSAKLADARPPPFILNDSENYLRRRDAKTGKNRLFLAVERLF